MTRFLTVIAATAAGLCSSALAGDLTPPAGPVAETMKTLDEVEPSTPVGPDTTPGDATAVYVIDQPGAYHLTGDVVGVAGKNGIAISTNDVTLDLRGFSLRGVASALNGIQQAHPTNPFGGVYGIAIRNGTVADWPASGLVLLSSNQVILESLHTRDNGQFGIAAGPQSRIVQCSALNNGNVGILAETESIVERCVAEGNSSSGFSVPGSIVRNCTSSNNGGGGFSGNTTSFYQCRASGNMSHGFVGAAVVRDSIAELNGASGFISVDFISNSVAKLNSISGYTDIEVATDCLATDTPVGFDNIRRAERCKAEKVDTGFDVAAEGTIRDCDVNGRNNATGAGIILNDGASAIGCIVDDPGIGGIQGGARNVVEDCVIVGPNAIGVFLGDAAQVRNTRVTNGDSVGIYAGNGAVISDCYVENVGDIGVFAGINAHVSGTTVRTAAQEGIWVDANSRVIDCLVNNIQRDGIRASRLCRIEGNTVDLVGLEAGYDGSGVYVTLQSNRIHNNNITRCDWSIRAATGSNAITENSWSAWFVGATNLAGGNTLGTNYAH